MHKYKVFVTGIVCLINLLSICGQSYTFHHLGTANGLSEVTVLDICQDEFGRMWFATRDGLNCYDGDNVRVYRPIPGDTTSLPSSRIFSVTGDRKGKLYLRAQSSFVIFDMKTERFKTIMNTHVVYVSQGKKGIWVCTEKELLLFNTETSQTQQVYSFKDRLTIYSIDEDSKGTCWISTSKGLLSLNGHTLSKYFPDQIIRKVIEDRNKNLWVLSANGLIQFNASQTKTYTHEDGNPASLVHNYIRTACIDDQGHIWLGSQYGLSRFNPATEEFETFLPTEGNSQGLSSRSITSLFKDSQGTIWMGTYFGGVNYLNIEKQPFMLYYPQPGGLTSSIVSKYAEDKRGIVWICTEGGGLCSYDPKTKKIDSYTSPHYRLPETNLKEIRYDEKADCLWLGTHTFKFYQFDLQTKTGTSYGEDLNEQFKNTNAIIPYEGKLLLGGIRGICLFDPSTRSIQHLAPGEESLKRAVNHAIIDSQNRLWVATNQGLVSYHLKEESLSHYEHKPGAASSLSSNFVNLIFEDSQQRIWVGTSGFGLNLYQPQTNDFKVYTKERHFLTDNNVVAIKESKSGKLLVATNNGLSALDKQASVFTSYTYKQGFPLRIVNEGSLFVDSRGAIYVGGIDGMTIFEESNLNTTASKPFHISFTRLFINNAEILEGDKTGILKQSFPFTDKIVLKAGQSSFSVGYMTDNYISSGTNEVEYRLKGYETQWMSSHFGNMLTYTNISPGEYELEIRSADFPTMRRSLTIVIKPPLYASWPAICLYALLILLLAGWAIKQVKTKFLLKSSLDFEKREKERTEEMTQLKLRFFTNVSHEFRTPITLIMGQAESLMHHYNIHPSIYSKVLNIYKNANNLKSLISELLDFNKQEQGHLKLKISSLNFIAFLEEIFITFKDYAVGLQIDFQFKHPQKEIDLWFDPEQMQKVINNLLSNAFKYTEKGGCIVLAVKEWDNDVEVSVSDNGGGIPKEELSHVFDRFYQSNLSQRNTGSGIGLSLSKGIVEAHQGEIHADSVYGEGSVFTVRLKKGDKHFDEQTSRIEQIKEISYYNKDLPDNAFIEEIKASQGEILSAGNKPKLLVVEDNEDLRNLLIEIFSPLYEVHDAFDGQDGWEKTKELNPDIVISDIMMPRISGIELCSKIKSHLDTCHIPVVLLTAKTAVEHKFEGLKIGADEYVTKPFDLKFLIIRCNNLVNNRRILQQKFAHNPSFQLPQLATNAVDLDILNRATEIVLENLQNDKLDVDFFARKMGLGRTSLFSKLKAVTGMTPNQFFVSIRLKKAAELLSNNPELNISEVAYSVGFGSPHYFNRCFKEQFGMAPLTYRQNHQHPK